MDWNIIIATYSSYMILKFHHWITSNSIYVSRVTASPFWEFYWKYLLVLLNQIIIYWTDIEKYVSNHRSYIPCRICTVPLGMFQPISACFYLWLSYYSWNDLTSSKVSLLDRTIMLQLLDSTPTDPITAKSQKRI